MRIIVGRHEYRCFVLGGPQDIIDQRLRMETGKGLVDVLSWTEMLTLGYVIAEVLVEDLASAGAASPQLD